MLEGIAEYEAPAEMQHEASRETVLSAAGISLAFGGNRVLRELDLELFAGDIVLLRGENGSGKTTLLNVLTGNLAPDRGKITIHAEEFSTTFSFPQSFWFRTNPATGFTPYAIARKGVGRSWQDTRLFSNLTVMENVQVAASRRLGEDPFSPLWAAASLRKQELALNDKSSTVLSRFGLGQLRNVAAMRLSLGDAKRTALARSIQAEARTLFLDEPLSGLDGSAVARTIDLLRSMVAQHRMTLVLIEHSFHIPRLLDLVNRVWTMKSGVLVEETVEEVSREFASLEHDGVAVWTDCLAAGGWREEVTRLPGDSSLTVLTRPGGDDTRDVLELKNMTVRRDAQQVIGPQGATCVENGVNLALKAGQIGILRAPNGWGKTSLAEAILGILPNGDGRIVHRGEDIQSMTTWERARRGIAFLQARDNTFASLTAREMMTLRRSRSTLDMASSLRNRSIEQLSGGERQRVALTACLGIPTTSLVILDEPFNMVDAAGVRQFQEHIEARADLAVLILLPGIDRKH